MTEKDSHTYKHKSPPDTAQGGFSFVPNGIREKNIFFYHPDHLGSSSYITGQDGKVSQHTEYIAFGEILFDEHNTEHTMPYLFNGKELDQETNLTYFGARYLDMKTSLWLNTDPLSGYNPTFEHEHYIDGQHNSGVFNPMNLNTYGYTYQNPVAFIDPNGKQAYFIHGTTSSSARWNNEKLVKTLLKITNNKHYNRKFNWDAPIYNYQKMRKSAAVKLAQYVMKHRVKGEEITLIGHSHGNNVSIQAAKLIYDKTKQKVNILSIAPPAYNKAGDPENPETQKEYINDHINLWNKLDSVSGDLAGDDYYNNTITTNIEIDVSNYYIKKNEKGKETIQGIEAHSFDYDHPELIQNAIDNGKIRKLNPIK
ncbi:MAG: RHS repeat domain-containing protein [Bergeyella cardium]